MNYRRTLARMLTILILVTITPTTMNAQEEEKLWWGRSHAERQNAEILKQRIANLMESRKEPLRTRPVKDMMDEENEYWWDGQQLCILGYGETDNIRPLVTFKKHGDEQVLYTLVCKKGKNGTTVTIKNHAGWKVALQQAGPWRVLVFRDATGAVQDCYIGTTWNDAANLRNVQNLSMHDFFDGVYETPDGEKVVFGPLMDHYKDLNYSRDPGIFCFHTNQDFAVTDTLEYGEGRVSRGDPSSPNWGKMPGGGGAAAIMGPMEWKVTPTSLGLKVKVIRDEPFVEHSPSIKGGEAELKWVQGPFEGIEGYFPIASVRPLPKGMLRQLPKGELHFIMQEILNRHATGSKPTAIEELNLGVIYAVLNE